MGSHLIEDVVGADAPRPSRPAWVDLVGTGPKTSLLERNDFDLAPEVFA